jgi:hypothetical protein
VHHQKRNIVPSFSKEANGGGSEIVSLHTASGVEGKQNVCDLEVQAEAAACGRAVRRSEARQVDTARDESTGTPLGDFRADDDGGIS